MINEQKTQTARNWLFIVYRIGNKRLFDNIGTHSSHGANKFASCDEKAVAREKCGEEVLPANAYISNLLSIEKRLC